RGARTDGVVIGPAPAACAAPPGSDCEKSLARGAAAAPAGSPSTATAATTPRRRRTKVATPIPALGLRRRSETGGMARHVAGRGSRRRRPSRPALPAGARVEPATVDDHVDVTAVGVDRAVLALALTAGRLGGAPV